VHEYAGRRAVPLLRFLPEKLQWKAVKGIEDYSLQLLARYYRIPRLLFAPNPELITLLERRTGKPCLLMSRGVDHDLFSPERREPKEQPFTLGYVGRLTTEKNVHFLVELERALLAAGQHDFRFLIVGQGSAEPWLQQHLQKAEFAGVLHGEALARAYANMDLFVFPSETDTFGNVVLEALSSGVPAITTSAGGPRFIVRHGETGFVANDLPDFVQRVQWLMTHKDQRETMSHAARAYALTASWDAVFNSVYVAYRSFLSAQGARNLVQDS
jgi:glycosyltransferase involved in cell wall biosynthesis